MQGIVPSDLLRRVGAREESILPGLDSVVARAFDTWESATGTDLFVAVTAADGWALIVEPNGYLGATRDVIVPLSRGTRLVSHYRNVNAVTRFYWIEDEG
jgi:hypothetical protein